MTINEYGDSLSLVEYLKSKGITKLYHFTDRSNIKSIIDNGGLYSWRACDRYGITINRPGGSDTSRSLDSYRGLGNYVRLSFTKNHPMMYVAKNDGRISDPVILEIDLSVVGISGTKFSDRNATKNGAIIRNGYDGARNIHFSTVRQLNHFDLSFDEKEFYQAEVLVLEKVPLSYITNIDWYRTKPQPSYTGSSNSSTRSNTSRVGSYTGSSYSSQSSYLGGLHSSGGSSSSYGSSYSSGSTTSGNSSSSYNSRPPYSSSSNRSTSSSSSSGSGCMVFIAIAVIITFIAAINF